MLQRTSTDRVYRVGHLFCGIGAGAKGFNQANPRVGTASARFECAGGIDVDAGAIRNFERLTGTRGVALDLFDREQYTAFHGRLPGPDWREASPADIVAAFGPHLDVMFLSAPCKGFSGLLSAKASGTEKYQALNRLTLRGMWLTLEAYKHDPIRIILFENVPRILTRGRALLDQIQALLRAYGYVFAETTHDCGEIGELAQSRKRMLMVARHADLVPPFLYQPAKGKLRGVGEVIGQLPLPGAAVAGPMHRVPMLQWKTWVRLAFVRAGADWRSLNELRVADGVLADYGIVPDGGMRDNQLGVCGWSEPAPTLTGQRSPAQGRFSVADPRPAAMHNEVLGVRGWQETTGTVAGASRPANGTYSVADPRYGERDRDSTLGVNGWSDTSGTVQGKSGPTNGNFSVADPRPQQANQSFGQYGVREWAETVGTVTGQAAPGGGPNSVADPRPPLSTNVFRIVELYDRDLETGGRLGGPVRGQRPRASAKSQSSGAGEGRQDSPEARPRAEAAEAALSVCGALARGERKGPAPDGPLAGLGSVHRPETARNGRASPQRQESRLPSGEPGVVNAQGEHRGQGNPRDAGARRAPSSLRSDTGARSRHSSFGPFGSTAEQDLPGRQERDRGDPHPSHLEAHRVADPRADSGFGGRGKYRVTRIEEPAGAVIAGSTTGQGAFAVADPRPTHGDQAHHNKMRVVDAAAPAPTVTGSDRVGSGALSVADPRPGYDGGTHQNVLAVTSYEGPAKSVTSARHVAGGVLAVADPRPAGLNADGRDVYATQGHYGVLDWEEPSNAVPGYAKHDRGSWSVVDPRAPAAEPLVALPAPNERLVARIVALDGTWHRPFTTLELAALQSLFDPGEVFDLEGGSDQVKREWIGNAVPSAAARGMAETIGETLLLADLGERFTLSSRAIWTKPLALALAVDPRQAIDGMDAA